MTLGSVQITQASLPLFIFNSFTRTSMYQEQSLHFSFIYRIDGIVQRALEFQSEDLGSNPKTAVKFSMERLGKPFHCSQPLVPHL